MKIFALFRLVKEFFVKINTRTIYLYSFFTGILAGFVAIGFDRCIHWLVHLMTPDTPNRLLVFLLPIFGGLITGFIIDRFSPEAAGGGTETFLDSFHNKGGVLRKRTSFTKFLTSVFTLSSGGSGGKEGPMTLIGAGLGSLFGKFIKMGARAQRTLLLAGAAGGLGAIFRTPLGGAITAVEVLYKEDFESDALIPCIISSVTAYTVFGSFLGFGHMLHFSSGIFHSPTELIFYVILALVCTGFGYVFVKLFHAFKSDFFQKLNVPRKFLPAIGGLMIGTVGLFVPEVLGNGLGVIQYAINGHHAETWLHGCLFFLLLAVLKMFTTACTIQSGGSAGTLVPSFFIGAMLGGAVGTVFQFLFPEMVPSVTPFVVVGMAAFFAAVTGASLGALVMVTELTGGYELLPPLMVVSVISLIFSHKWSIYNNQKTNKFFSKAHLWDMNPQILKNVSLTDSFKEFHQKAAIDRSLAFEAIKTLAKELHVSDFAVTSNQKLLGVLSLRDLECEEEQDILAVGHILVAEDMLHTDSFYLSKDETLFKAMQYLSSTDFDMIPVVDNKEQKTFLGYLTRKDILKYYNSLGTTA